MPAGIVSLVDYDEENDEGSGPCDSCDSGGDCVCDAGDGTWT